jgi:hypothetical protein
MTPNIIDRDIKKLLDKLNASHEPVYLNVEPDTNAELSDCFPVVQKKVQKCGGRMIMGWQIWKAKYLVEAECHAVWEDNEGDLHDITPKPYGINRILFVEDENLVYNGKQIDNVRLNITSNSLVDDLINVCIAIHKFDNKGERAELYDLSTVLDSSQLKHKYYLLELKEIINFILQNNGNRNSFCPCQSGKKFNECHGKNLNQMILKDI